jgi:hypothetical protein
MTGKDYIDHSRRIITCSLPIDAAVIVPKLVKRWLNVCGAVWQPPHNPQNKVPILYALEATFTRRKTGEIYQPKKMSAARMSRNAIYPTARSEQESSGCTVSSRNRMAI